MNNTQILTATIASSGTVSTVVDLSQFSWLALEMPASLDSTAMTFQAASGAGGVETYKAVTGVSITVAANEIASLTGTQLASLIALGRIKLVAGTTETAERSITVIARA